MTTYKEIQQYVMTNFGYSPKTCWIAHAKEIYGLSPRVANNRYDINHRVHPCPSEKQADLKKAFQHFGML